MKFCRLAFFHVLLLAIGVGPLFAQTTLNLQVASGTNNADQATDGTTWVNDSFAAIASNYCGFRFQNVTIPQGATITSATLELRAFSNGTGGFTAYINAQAADTTATFATTSNNISNRPRTSAQVTWTLASGSFSDGQVITSPNISAVVQEVVSRSGWSSGTSLTIISTPVSGNYACYKYAGNASYAAKLSVTYTTAAASSGKKLLMVTDTSTLTSQETLRKTQFETWGFTVNTIEDNSSQSSFDTALAAADVCYLSEEAMSTDLEYKIREASIGVVSEESLSDDYMGFATSNGAQTTTSTIAITDNTHPITAGFSTGSLGTVSSSDSHTQLQGTLAPGGSVLATVGGTSALIAVEKGGQLATTYNSSNIAFGRRVRLPIAGATFSWSNLNANGLNLVKQSILWAASNGLVGHWKLSASSGTTAIDSSLYAVNGTYVNGVTLGLTGPRDDTVADFDGVNDRVQLPSSTAHNVRRQFTIASWINVDTHVQHATVLERGFSAVAPFMFFTNSTGTIGLTVNYLNPSGSTAPTSTFSSTGALTVGRWHHVAVTWDGANVKFYIDGKLDSTHSLSGLLGSTGEDSSIGASMVGNDEFLDCRLGDVRLYDRALSLSEIVTLYGLIGHWKLDETSGTVATDSSGKAINGTYTNGATPGSNGVRGYAGSFDGVDDHVTISGGSDYNLQKSLTVSCWAKSDTATWSGHGCLVSKRNQFYLHPSYGDTTIRMAVNKAGPIAETTANYDVETLGGIQVWHHYAGVYNYSAGTVKMYIDGVLRDTHSFTAKTSLNSDTGAVTIGWDDGIGGTRYFDGVIDDVRLYDRALSSNEIEKLYGKLHHWKLNESSGTTVADSGPGSLNGAFTTGTPTWTDGLRGDGLDFGGVSDLQTNSNFDPPETGTVALWFKPNALPADKERLFGNGGLWEMHLFSTGAIGCDFNTNAGGLFEAPAGSAAAGQWRHVVAMYDTPSGRYELYLDGEQIESGTLALAKQAAAPLKIGNQYGDTRYFNGVIDDVVVYDRMATETEVAELFGKLGHWKLDETSGTAAADATVFQRDGVYTNGAAPGADGLRAYAVTLDGVDDFIVVSDTDDTLDTSKSISVGAWVRLDALTTGTQRIAGKGTGNGYQFRIMNTGIAEFEVELEDLTSPQAVSTDAITVGRWTHLLGTYNGNRLRLYVDGQLDSELTAPGLISDSVGDILIGQHPNGTHPLDGRVDDVVLYDREMTEQEIAEHYGLVGRWKLDETSGAVAADSSGMGKHGTISSVPTMLVAGPKSGDFAMKFDGVDDHVVLPAYDFDFDDGFSMSVWARPTASSNWARFLEISNGENSDNILFSRWWSTSTLALDVYQGNTRVGTPRSGTITNGLWRNYTVSVSAAGAVTFYVDGVAQSSGTSSLPNNLQRSVNYIGRSVYSSNAYYQGDLADVRLYNRPLTDEEARALYYGDYVEGLRIIKWVEVANP